MMTGYRSLVFYQKAQELVKGVNQSKGQSLQ
jgi:hypothetical protein